MSRRDEIKSAYKNLGKAHSFYDGMMTGTSFFGRIILKNVWCMTKEDALEYQAAAFEAIPKDFSGSLLEVPVGTGVLSMPVWKTLPDAEITCLDYSEKMMQSAQERADEMQIKNIRFLQGDVGKLPFEDESFDCVVSLNGFRQLDNGSCRGYNLDFPDVIKIRNDLLPAGDREKNIPCDLNDTSWFDEIDGTNGAVFFAAGVFYYFRTEDAIRLFDKMAEHFPGGVLVFDACNKRGVKLMLKTWIKEADIKDVGAYFAVKDAEKELLQKSSHFAEVSHKSYMRGYRNIDKSIRPLYRLLNTMCDRLINMQIVKIRFR